jgi:hypothetical protein
VAKVVTKLADAATIKQVPIANRCQLSFELLFKVYLI